MHKIQKSLPLLENLIRKLEVNLGVAQKPSPFEKNFSTVQKPIQEKQQPEVKVQPVQEKTQTEEKKQPQKLSKEEYAALAEKKKQESLAKAQSEPKQKKEKKPLEPVNEPTQEEKNLDDFYKSDIRVGKIIECWKHPESENLYCEKIDLGDEVREIASGLQKFVDIKDMTGLVMVYSNLKPKKLAGTQISLIKGFQSAGMVLCASNADHTKVELMRPAEGTQVGERVVIQGSNMTQDKQVELNPKHKISDRVLPLLFTNGEKQAQFDGKLLVTSKGPITSQTMANEKVQ